MTKLEKRILKLLGKYTGRLTAAQIKDTLGVSKDDLTAAVETLHVARLVDVTPHGTHASVGLTEKGWQSATELRRMTAPARAASSSGNGPQRTRRPGLSTSGSDVKPGPTLPEDVWLENRRPGRK